MILDKTLNRQRITRRVLIGALGISVVLLVGLAVMRPTAKAQAALARPGTAEFLGVQDIDIHHTDRRWWDAEGKTLVGGVNAEAPSRSATDLFRSSNDKNLRFAVRLPDAAQGRSVTFAASGSFALGSFALKEAAPLVGSRGHVWSLYTDFSGSTKTTTLSVGFGAGPWTEAVNCPKTAGKVRRDRPSGEVLFALFPNPKAVASAQEIYGLSDLTPAQAAPSNAILVVSDHFHYPSPLKVDKMAIMISSYASLTRSGEAVQKIQHDAENCERIVYGLDKSGRVIAKLTGTMYLTLEDENNDLFKMVQLISIPRPLLTRIASFRLAARPYQWTEFKNVALQPVK